jgi:hypothetical protein
MRVERITPEITRGKGWARVSFMDCELLSEFVSMTIVRPRHMEAHLGRMGWQISENRLPLDMEVTGDSEFALILPPTVVQHLQVASNYEFCFFDRNLQRRSSLILRWERVSYRAPGGAISPIEILQPNQLIQEHKIVGTDEKVDGTGGTVEQGRHGLDSPSWPFAPIWKGAPVDEPLSTNVAAPKDGFLAESDAKPTIPAFAVPPTLPQSHVGTYDRKEVRRIRCNNPHCGAEILDSMTMCPFCGVPRKTGL